MTGGDPTDGAPTLDPGALDRLLEMTGGDPAFVDELIETFLEDAVVQLDALTSAAATGGVDALVRPAHSLKSNSASVGAVRLTELARGLEADARGGPVTDAQARVATLVSELAAVRAALHAARDKP